MHSLCTFVLHRQLACRMSCGVLLQRNTRNCSCAWQGISGRHYIICMESADTVISVCCALYLDPSSAFKCISISLVVLAVKHVSHALAVSVHLLELDPPTAALGVQGLTQFTPLM